MNLTVSKRDLLQIATRAASVAEKKSTMPTLSMVKLDAGGSRLTLSATDLYQSLIDSCAADVAKPGAIAVGGADLVARIKSMPDGLVDLSTKDGTLTMKSTGSARKFNQRGLDANDYPPLPSYEPGSPKLTIDAPVLASLIAHTAFSASTDETRAHLNGVFFEWSGDVIRAVSTDGHRLSLAERKVAGQSSMEMLLPLKAVRAINELATSIVGVEDAPAAITLIRSGPTAFFLAGTASFSVKLIDANFPPWKQVVPTSTTRVVRISRTAFADALRAVSIAANVRSGGVKLSFSKGKLLLQSESPETGNGADEISVDYAGENISTGFNAGYLIEVLSALSGDEVQLELNDELDPMVIKPVQQSATEFTGVCMPMRI